MSFDATVACSKAFIREIARIIFRTGYGNEAHNSGYNSGSGESNSTHTPLLTENIISRLKGFENPGSSSNAVCQYPIKLYFPKVSTHDIFDHVQFLPSPVYICFIFIVLLIICT